MKLTSHFFATAVSVNAGGAEGLQAIETIMNPVPDDVVLGVVCVNLNSRRGEDPSDTTSQTESASLKDYKNEKEQKSFFATYSKGFVNIENPKTNSYTSGTWEVKAKKNNGTFKYFLKSGGKSLPNVTQEDAKEIFKFARSSFKHWGKKFDFCRCGKLFPAVPEDIECILKVHGKAELPQSRPDEITVKDFHYGLHASFCEGNVCYELHDVNRNSVCLWHPTGYFLVRKEGKNWSIGPIGDFLETLRGAQSVFGKKSGTLKQVELNSEQVKKYTKWLLELSTPDRQGPATDQFGTFNVAYGKGCLAYDTTRDVYFYSDDVSVSTPIKRGTDEFEFCSKVIEPEPSNNQSAEASEASSEELISPEDGTVAEQTPTPPSRIPSDDPVVPNHGEHGQDEDNNGVDNGKHGPDEVNKGPDNGKHVQDEDNIGADNVKHGSDEVNKGPDEDNKGADKGKHVQDEDNNGADNGKHGPDEVNKGADKGKVVQETNSVSAVAPNRPATPQADVRQGAPAAPKAAPATSQTPAAPKAAPATSQTPAAPQAAPDVPQAAPDAPQAAPDAPQAPAAPQATPLPDVPQTAPILATGVAKTKDSRSWGYWPAFFVLCAGLSTVYGFQKVAPSTAPKDVRRVRPTAQSH